MPETCKEVAPGSPSDSKANPEINQFVLYAERSIKIGNHSHADEGDVGVRTALAPQQDAPQLSVGKHGKCRNLFAPSTALEIYSEVREVWTDSLTRDQDIEIGTVGKFPAGMPQLPLAIASGRGADITVAHETQHSLSPGTYGVVTLLHKSELWLAEGIYTFASVKMDEDSTLLADPGGVDVRIVGRLWMDREAKIAPQGPCPEARNFTIFVADSDPVVRGKDGADAAKDPSIASTPVVVIGEEAHVHALLAAPHGTIWMADKARV